MSFTRLVVAGVLLAGCAGTRPPATSSPQPASSSSSSAAAADVEPFPSTYHALPSQPTFITNATIMTATGPTIQRGSLLMRDGKIEAVGANLTAPAGVRVIDANGKWVTPGIIDTHSHLGVYAAPGIAANSDGNEATAPVTAEVWAERRAR